MSRVYLPDQKDRSARACWSAHGTAATPGRGSGDRLYIDRVGRTRERCLCLGTRRGQCATTRMPPRFAHQARCAYAGRQSPRRPERTNRSLSCRSRSRGWSASRNAQDRHRADDDRQPVRNCIGCRQCTADPTRWCSRGSCRTNPELLPACGGRPCAKPRRIWAGSGSAGSLRLLRLSRSSRRI